MAKQLRFGDLVKQCGQPETLTLWTKPEDNAGLKKAIRENRVLTVIQEPASHKTDFGLIGFHQHQFALYFIFPHHLPKAAEDTTVIGIHYEQVKEPSGRKGGRKRTRAPEEVAAAANGFMQAPLPMPRPAPSPEAAKKRYTVTVLRTAKMESKVDVTAGNIRDAEAQARKEISKVKFTPADIQTEVTAITEKS